MADFTALKTAIQQHIAQNGNEEITGNLLQTILLAMVQSMGDQAINGLQQLLSNEMIARENQDGYLGQALTAEQQRAIAAETKSAELVGETKTLVFKNAAGQPLYQVSVASLVSNGLVDVEVDGTNLVMTFHTDSGNEEITIPIGDIFNPSNYYTKTQVDGLLSPITTAISNLSSRLNNGYLYLGLADPETIPTSATGKFFYIASQAGTYHFMSNGDIPIVISSDGLYILSGGVEADDWLLETIVTFTNNVQFNNSRLITSGGVFNAINPINELLHRNYMLAGVADTTTIPTEDTNVFYLAGQGGTYTHFLNGDDDPLILPKGLTVIYRGVEDDGWNYWVVYADNDFINTNRAQALTSDQQTEAQNNMIGKSYAPAQFSGLGKKILAKNIQQVGGVDKNVMTQAFFEDEQGNALTNTVFVIQYDYTLGENITIPAGCTLQFDGGSISGAYTITGTYTQILAGDITIFKSGIIIAGTWNCPKITSAWISDVTSDNRLKQLFNLTDENINNSVYIAIGTYAVSASAEKENIIPLKNNTTIILNGIVQLSPNALDECMIFSAIEKKNITIYGSGKIVGDLDGHLGTTGEGGIGINLEGSSNVIVRGITIEQCWGDGIYIGGWHGQNSCITVDGVNFSYMGRAAISVTIGNNIILKNLTVDHANEITQTAGIDIEPNTTNIDVKNVLVDNIFVSNARHSVDVIENTDGKAVENVKISNVVSSLPIHINSINSKNISIDNCFVSSGYFIGDVLISNCELTNPGFYSTSRTKIQNCKISGTGDLSFYTAEVYDSTITAVGKVKFMNSTKVYNCDITCNGIEGQSGAESKQMLINNTIKTQCIQLYGAVCVIQSNHITIVAGSGTNAVFDAGWVVKLYVIRDNYIIFDAAAPRMIYARTQLNTVAIFKGNIVVDANYSAFINDPSVNDLGWNFDDNFYYDSSTGATTTPEKAIKSNGTKPLFRINGNWVDATGTTV